MSDVFADTYYFVALVNRKGDEARARAMDATRMRNGRLVTTGWILTELANTLSEPRHRQLFLNILATLQGDTQTSIIQPDAPLFEQGIALFAARPDKEWSLTDCISFIVMQREGITEALTGDRHFEQAGFVALLK
jgi:predicted nucleic acid-binding protein